eukprot:jgi/Botrbrau1/21182/Bobra.0061s0073.1
MNCGTSYIMQSFSTRVHPFVQAHMHQHKHRAIPPRQSHGGQRAMRWEGAPCSRSFGGGTICTKSERSHGSCGPTCLLGGSGREHGRVSTASGRVDGRRESPRGLEPAHPPTAGLRWGDGLLTGAAGAVLAAAVYCGGLGLPSAALATDVAKVGTCLLANCQVELAKCVGDFECLENLVCLNTCTNRPDETACQIRCGDLYADKAVEAFNACAVSERKCVPQRVDKNLFPVPPDCSLDTQFDLNMFQGRWYITAGLNRLFDTFDCQEHFFGVPEPGNLYAKINWRIDKGDNDFIERSTIQTFNQDMVKPAVLYNHDNEYLHYEDDWYILASKPEEYVVVYYRGNNDAWTGYGGAVIYTRAASLPQEIVPEVSAAVERAGMKWSDFVVTDNTCGPHPPPVPLIQKVERGAGKVVEVVEKEAEGDLSALRNFVAKEARQIESELERDLLSFGKGFTVIEKDLLEVLQGEGKSLPQVLVKDASELEEKARKFLETVEAKYAPPPFAINLPNIFQGFRPFG